MARRSNVNVPWPDLIAYASRLMTLNPGDIISTGMPHGTHDEIYLRPGDTSRARSSASACCATRSSRRPERRF